MCGVCALALQLLILSVGGQAFCGAITRYNHNRLLAQLRFSLLHT